MVAFVVIVVALIVGPALLIAQLSSDLGLFFPWVASIIGLAFVALGVMGSARLDRWLGNPPREPHTPYLRRRAAISGRGLRLFLILFGLASIILAPRPSDPTTPE